MKAGPILHLRRRGTMRNSKDLRRGRSGDDTNCETRSMEHVGVTRSARRARCDRHGDRDAPSRERSRDHSDRGVQYACTAYRQLLAEHGITASMSRVADCYDNALKESFWATLKKELVHDMEFATFNEARAAIFEWIEVFYQRERSHSALGYLSPEAFEAAARRNQ